LSVNGITISISASVDVYQKAFSTTLQPVEMKTVKGSIEDTATFIRPENSTLPGTIDVRHTSFSDVLEGVAINDPVYYMNSFIAPKQSYWHLSVPGDISAGLNADRAHRIGITGKGINVAMVDSGWYRHSYFSRRGYKVNPVVLSPSTNSPLIDEDGHGTGESANLFAIAPDVNLTMVKMNFVDSAGALNTAVRLRPQIISCSWGGDRPVGPLSGYDLVLSAAVANATSQGITVVFAAGNSSYGFPGQHPDVISVGGVYVDEKLTLQASDYASAYISTIFPGRHVPDVCGLVGLQPTAAYIMLPIPPGATLDISRSGGIFPQQDQTKPNDGWAAFSGTSAAAPQIAGICALLKQAKPSLSPSDIKRILQLSAYDVTAGKSHERTGGHTAGVGMDIATGFGLANAYRALSMI
jgi:subtilisin family serine protease